MMGGRQDTCVIVTVARVVLKYGIRIHIYNLSILLVFVANISLKDQPSVIFGD